MQKIVIRVQVLSTKKVNYALIRYVLPFLANLSIIVIEYKKGTTIIILVVIGISTVNGYHTLYV